MPVGVGLLDHSLGLDPYLSIAIERKRVGARGGKAMTSGESEAWSKKSDSLDEQQSFFPSIPCGIGR